MARFHRTKTCSLTIKQTMKVEDGHRSQVFLAIMKDGRASPIARKIEPLQTGSFVVLKIFDPEFYPPGAGTDRRLDCGKWPMREAQTYSKLDSFKCQWSTNILQFVLPFLILRHYANTVGALKITTIPREIPKLENRIYPVNGILTRSNPNIGIFDVESWIRQTIGPHRFVELNPRLVIEYSNIWQTGDTEIVEQLMQWDTPQ